MKICDFNRVVSEVLPKLGDYLYSDEIYIENLGFFKRIDDKGNLLFYNEELGTVVVNANDLLVGDRVEKILLPLLIRAVEIVFLSPHNCVYLKGDRLRYYHLTCVTGKRVILMYQDTYLFTRKSSYNKKMSLDIIRLVGSEQFYEFVNIFLGEERKTQ